jgi:hypothetical protein
MPTSKVGNHVAIAGNTVMTIPVSLHQQPIVGARGGKVVARRILSEVPSLQRSPDEELLVCEDPDSQREGDEDNCDLG